MAGILTPLKVRDPGNGSGAPRTSAVPTPTTPTPTAPTPPTPWQPADASVDTQLDKVLSQSNPLMKRATTTGMQTANRRGLLNSSIAAGAAQNAVIDAALPIASQNASQINQTNLSQMGINSNEKVAFANIASNDREKAQAAAAQAEQTYAQLLGTITNNEKIPKAYRDKLMEHVATLRDNYYSVVEQMYGLNLDWASPATPK